MVAHVRTRSVCWPHEQTENARLECELKHICRRAIRAACWSARSAAPIPSAGPSSLTQHRTATSTRALCATVGGDERIGLHRSCCGGCRAWEGTTRSSIRSSPGLVSDPLPLRALGNNLVHGILVLHKMCARDFDRLPPLHVSARASLFLDGAARSRSAYGPRPRSSMVDPPPRSGGGCGRTVWSSQRRTSSASRG